MVDAKTGKVTEYKMPNPKAKDPHTIAFLRDGRLFFTVQAGNFVGTPRSEGAGRQHQLDRSADRELAPVRRAPRLQGRAVLRRVQLQQDRQHRSEDAGHPRVSSCRRRTRAPRRIAIGKDDTVWYGDYARGFLGHLDPKTGQGRGVPVARRRRVDALRDRRHADGAGLGMSRPATMQKNVLVRFNPRRRSS